MTNDKTIHESLLGRSASHLYGKLEDIDPKTASPAAKNSYDARINALPPNEVVKNTRVMSEAIANVMNGDYSGPQEYAGQRVDSILSALHDRDKTQYDALLKEHGQELLRTAPSGDLKEALLDRGIAADPHDPEQTAYTHSAPTMTNLEREARAAENTRVAEVRAQAFSAKPGDTLQHKIQNDIDSAYYDAASAKDLSAMKALLAAGNKPSKSTAVGLMVEAAKNDDDQMIRWLATGSLKVPVNTLPNPLLAAVERGEGISLRDDEPPALKAAKELIRDGASPDGIKETTQLNPRYVSAREDAEEHGAAGDSRYQPVLNILDAASKAAGPARAKGVTGGHNADAPHGIATTAGKQPASNNQGLVGGK